MSLIHDAFETRSNRGACGVGEGCGSSRPPLHSSEPPVWVRNSLGYKRYLNVSGWCCMSTHGDVIDKLGNVQQMQGRPGARSPAPSQAGCRGLGRPGPLRPWVSPRSRESCCLFCPPVEQVPEPQIKVQALHQPAHFRAKPLAPWPCPSVCKWFCRVAWQN